MKKYSAVIFVLLIMLFISACGETTTITPTPADRELRFPEDFTVEEIKLPKPAEGDIYSAAFSPDGSICVNLMRSIVIYDNRQTLIKTISNAPGEFFHTVAFDAKGNLYAGGNSNPGDNFIRVYSAGGELLKDYKNLFATQDCAIIKEIIIDKAGDMYVLIKYGSISRWSVAVLDEGGQLIKEVMGGKVTPRSLFTDESGSVCAGCWYADRPVTEEPRLYKFSGITGMKYDSFDEYTDYTAVETEYRSVIDKNGILYLPYRTYYDGFKKSCDINLYNSGFDFSNHVLAGWTKDNDGNAVFWLGQVMTSGGPGESAEYNGSLYRVKLKATDIREYF